MGQNSFQSVYAHHYRHVSRAAFLIPIVLMLVFTAILATLSFVKTDRVVNARGVILPYRTYVSRLTLRGFVVENHVRLGQFVRLGETLATLRLDNGALETIGASHDGVVVDSGLRNVVDGPLNEGSLVATVVDPRDLTLKVPVPAQVRGTLRVGSEVRYKFDTFFSPTYSVVDGTDINLLEDGKVDYFVYAHLSPEHQRIEYLGKAVPLKLLVTEVSLLDYFLVY
jgi:hypothetical protein